MSRPPMPPRRPDASATDHAPAPRRVPHRTRRALLLCLSLGLPPALALPGGADARPGGRRRDDADADGPSGGPAVLPLAEAAARVAGRYSGRLLDARLVPGRPDEAAALVYELRWLTPGGDVLRARLDARSGAMIEVDGPAQFDARLPPPAATGARP